MFAKKTFKYRLKPSRKQKQLCAQFAGSCRWIFNHGLVEKKKAYEEEKKSLSYYDLNNELPLLKRVEETSWLKDVHSQVLQQALKDLDCAFQNFFRRVRNKEEPGYPRFKSKGEKDSFRYPQGVKVKGGYVFLPKIGMVRFKKSREIEGIIKQTTVILDAGRWYVCFSCEVEEENLLQELDIQSAVGIDMGIATFATLATGEKNSIEEITNPHFLKNHLSKLRYLSKTLSRKGAKSRNRYKAKLKLQRFQKRLRDCRKDFAHKLSTRIVKSHDIIGVESLSIASLMQSGLTALVRSIADAGWRQFLGYVTYKAQKWGKVLYAVNRWFASTKTCSCCGRKHELQLSDRTLRCSCGFEIGRDINAAINIKNEAIKKLTAAGMTVLKPVELPEYRSYEAGISRL